MKESGAKRRKASKRVVRMRKRIDRLNGEPRPQKTDMQVYVTKKGKCYHPLWCAAVNGTWLAGLDNLNVLSWVAAEAGDYKICHLCEQGQSIDERD